MEFSSSNRLLDIPTEEEAQSRQEEGCNAPNLYLGKKGEEMRPNEEVDFMGHNNLARREPIDTGSDLD